MAGESRAIQELFQRLASIPTADRSAILDRECGSDSDLRRGVLALLAAHDEEARNIDEPTRHFSESMGDSEATREQTPDPAGQSASVTQGPGDRKFASMRPEAAIAGRYFLQEKIDEGGMGEVWFARQSEPVRRNVALKLIKTGMDSRGVLQRFELERQALALMDHPNIARVYDGGVTPTGQPFFVMELVNGQTLTRFCDDRQLSLQERLELFVPICQAVQHAHQKGIVHRDLKPANILVTLVDGRAVPKVIDFGVAKATADRLTGESLSTQVGAVVGTLEYMSPEQAGLSGEDIDTRSDIYSLGVILYELLTGLRPIDARRLKQAALMEMIRIIQEVEPSKPSTRLSTDEALPSLAALRQTDPRRLTALLRGELDWVVMKCLEKQRDRRYETANALARDIQRFLADEPVEARPPSTAYRLRKFLQRHRGPVLAASLVLLALLLGIIGTARGYLAATEQARIAEQAADAMDQARREEAAQRLIAVENERRAVDRLNQLEQTTEILVSVFRNLEPNSEEKEGLPLRAILARQLNGAAESLQKSSLESPLSAARLQSWLGTALTGVGDPAAAIPLLEASLATSREHTGMDDPVTLGVANQLALAYRSTARIDEALVLLLDTLTRSQAALGPGHLETLGCMNNLSATYRAAGQTAKALPLYLETEAQTRATMGPDHQSTLAATNDLALAYQDLGQLDKALPLFVDTLARARDALGRDHVFTLNSLNNLASAQFQSGQRDQAMPLFNEALAGRRATLGPDHPATLESMNSLALAYVDARQPDKALPLLEETLAGRRARLPPDHPRTLGTMQVLAEALMQTGQVDRGLQMLTETLARTEATLGPDHPNALGLMNNLAVSLWSARRFDKSVPMFQRLLQLHEAQLGPDHPLTINVLANLGVNYRDGDRLPEAIKALEDAVERLDRHPPVNVARLEWVHSAMASTYDLAGQFELAEPGHRRMWTSTARQFGDNHPNTAAMATNLADNLLRQLKFAEAEPLLTAALATRKQGAPDHWTTFHTRSLLGTACLGQQKYAAAEPHLLAGYDGLLRSALRDPAQAGIRLTEILQQIVRLYEGWDKPEEAARWQAILDQSPPATPPPSNLPPAP